MGLPAFVEEEPLEEEEEAWLLLLVVDFEGWPGLTAAECREMSLSETARGIVRTG